MKTLFSWCSIKLYNTFPSNVKQVPNLQLKEIVTVITFSFSSQCTNFPFKWKEVFWIKEFTWNIFGTSTYTQIRVTLLLITLCEYLTNLFPITLRIIVKSSHTIEHFPLNVISWWYRLLDLNGCLITAPVCEFWVVLLYFFAVVSLGLSL